ncbi:MAG: LD-carboxypeptidase [Lachnospiraceae bacterium]|nr:LD-carboxypeptidase [Lachnospiraceae bacterium]
MRFPKNIKTGDTIGVIAPSFGASSSPFKDRLDRSVENFEKAGYRVKLGPNAFLGEGLGKSNTPEKCAAEIMDFFTDNSVDAIFAAGGGETMCEDLRFVDFEKLAAVPAKWFSGFSDNTNLTFTLATQCDTASIYGAHAAHFWHTASFLGESQIGDVSEGRSARETLEIMKGERKVAENRRFWETESIESDDPFREPNLTEPFGMKVFVPEENCTGRIAESMSLQDLDPEGKTVRFEGRLIGGCLDCLQVLAGTPYSGTEKFVNRYKDEGIVWFFEACDLNPMGIRRALWQLRESGWFEGTKGFLIGRPLHFGEDILGMNQYNAVTGILAEFGVPILMDLDIGHTEQMMPLVTGSRVIAQTNGNAVSVIQNL